MLVDEQFGGDVPELAQRARPQARPCRSRSPARTSSTSSTARTSAPTSRSSTRDFSKVLVRYNPDGDAEMNERQLGRLKQLADWLHEQRPPVPVRAARARRATTQLESVGGDTDRYDAELRPELMRRAIERLQDFGIEVDIWKIEGVDDAARTPRCWSEQARKGDGRENVNCVLLGRGASDEKVDHWLQQAAPVEGFIGFAIGRSIWWDALKGFLDGEPRRAGGGRADRRQLPALHQGLRRCGAATPAV